MAMQSEPKPPVQKSKRKRPPRPGFWKEHAWEIAVAVAVIAGISAVARKETYQGEDLDALVAGQFGDFIGGYIGTIVLVISVALIFASYRNQRKTNERNGFETRFFELLKFHRENVSEIGIGSTVSGRRVFVSLIREFRECRELIRKECSKPDLCCTPDQQMDIAYLAFYYGVGQNSSRVLAKALAHHRSELVAAIIDALEKVQKDYRDASEKLASPLASDGERVSWEKFRRKQTRLSYCPFDGHQSRLGHYYRHLYHTIKYVDLHAPEKTEQEYAAIVRAQLTNHEQALLCLNALSKVGEDWVKTEFLSYYALIKNIPQDFFDPETEIDLKKKFPGITFEFEDPTSESPNRSPFAPPFEGTEEKPPQA
jgi:hypothetical protein